MTEIDWSKAPTGANQYQPAATPNNRPVFWRVEDGVAREVWAINPDGSVRDHFTYGPEGCQAYSPWRCIVKPVEWDGEGLPPLGADVECTFAVEDKKFWHHGNVVYRGLQPEGDDFIVVKTEQFSACYREGGGMVRPYRTPEQRAEEARKVEIAELADDISAYQDHRDPCGRHFRLATFLIDQGYGKQVKTCPT